MSLPLEQADGALAAEQRIVRFGLIGYGYWGPLLLRNLTRQDRAEVVLVADLSESRQAEARRNHPGIKVTGDAAEILDDATIDAVAIATPLGTHFALAKEALLRGKHVLVEKPLTASAAEAEALISLAEKQGRILMVGHTFEYSPEVERLQKMVAEGELGRIYYINSSRLNLGIFRKDADVIWDLAPHDLSMINFILGKRPLAVSARGAACVHENLLDVAYIDLKYPDEIIAHIHVSWLNPNKERRFTIVGDRRMPVYDDTAGNEKIRIFDRGVDRPDYSSTFGEFQLSYRYGAITIPFVQGAEPLALECQDFAHAIRTGRQPRSHGMVGLNVVRALAAAHDSYTHSGAYIDIDWGDGPTP
ncbi:MAG TPA: Gfo/Idh/MocA family oxidoreductase [Ktedonobacterales bacterium]|nr:Gfo/Idh/MocA family oxidoreductase [Ktedonobacterales bacterium]